VPSTPRKMRSAPPLPCAKIKHAYRLVANYFTILFVDETHPVCNRCIKAGFDCEGYRESFVDGRQQILRRIQHTVSSSAKTVSSSSRSGLDPRLLDISQGSNRTQCLLYNSQQPRLSLSLSAVPWKKDICLSYLIANTTGPIATVCSNLALQSCWPDSLQMTTTKLCFTALATTFFGLSHAQKSLVHDGRHLYGLALQALSVTINDSSCCNIEILSAVFALSLHEVS
jgi:hypothetical protein